MVGTYKFTCIQHNPAEFVLTERRANRRGTSLLWRVGEGICNQDGGLDFARNGVKVGAHATILMGKMARAIHEN